jgi:hypothetical protein
MSGTAPRPAAHPSCRNPQSRRNKPSQQECGGAFPLRQLVAREATARRLSAFACGIVQQHGAPRAEHRQNGASRTSACDMPYTMIEHSNASA